ncbi:hypothetical protein D3C75_1125040 [compost metagenome]
MIGQRALSASCLDVATRRAPSNCRLKSSRTSTRVAIAATAIMAPPTKKVPRMPTHCGRKPPTSGPIKLPDNAPVDSTPSAHPAFSRGTWDPIITIDAEA